MDIATANALLDALGRLPAWLVMGFFWWKVLEVRGTRLFWVLWMALWVEQSVRMPAAPPGTVEAALQLVFQLVVFPLVVARNALWYRILTLVTTGIVMLMAEMLTTLLVPLIGVQVSIDFRNVLGHPLQYAVGETMFTLVYALLLYLLYLALTRAARQQSNPALRYFGLGLFAQLAVTTTMVSVAEYFAWGNQVILVGACVFAFVNITADALILALVGRANAAWEQRVRADGLRARLDAVLGHFRDLAGEVQAVARFRHDLRDELQAVAALVRRGDYVRAEALVGELEARLGERASEGGA